MMFNRETICKGIHDVKSWPVTPENALTMAALIYLHKHWDHHEKDGHETDDENKRWTPEVAKRWVSDMENADGTRGAHWSMEKTEEVRKQRGVDAAPLEFWATMNMMYSDYCLAADKLGVNSVEFYVCMSKAFLEDRDARPEKLARYYEYIAKH